MDRFRNKFGMTENVVKNMRPSRLADLQTSPKAAFTLAEVLITLGIIGVVAAMTIPTLVANYQERSFNTSATVFERKLGEALKVMNSQMTLAGHSSTESFVEELGRHFKINRVCDNDELLNCFEEEVFWGSGTATPEAVDMNVIKTSKNFGQKDWEQTNVIGVQFANGTSALIAYNKDASQDPYSNQIVTLSGSSNGKSGSVSLGTDALAILYDTNGAKSPNQSAKDLRSINVAKLSQGCFAEVNGVCITMAPFVPTPMTFEECTGYTATYTGSTEATPAGGEAAALGISQCYYRNDYWAGAVKTCGGVDKMATASDLIEIANYVYNTDRVSAIDFRPTSNLTFDATKAIELGMPSPPFYIWTGEENSQYYAYQRSFDSTSSTNWYAEARYSNLLAICVE